MIGELVCWGSECGPRRSTTHGWFCRCVLVLGVGGGCRCMWRGGAGGLLCSRRATMTVCLGFGMERAMEFWGFERFRLDGWAFRGLGCWGLRSGLLGLRGRRLCHRRADCALRSVCLDRQSPRMWRCERRRLLGMLMIEVVFGGDLVGGGCWNRVQEMIEMEFQGRREK